MRAKLRTARERKNISVADFAKELKISASFYYKIEKGIRNPTIELAKVIADKLGKTVDELFFADKLDEPSKELDQAANQ
jgi:putative transcriptional regulator